MDFSFASTELRSICESRKKAIKAIGLQAAHELANFLADLEALGNVSELIALYSTDVITRTPKELSIRLEAGYDLVFCAGHVKVPIIGSGETDWSNVTRIKFIMLEAIHG